MPAGVPHKNELLCMYKEERPDQPVYLRMLTNTLQFLHIRAVNLEKRNMTGKYSSLRKSPV